MGIVIIIAVIAAVFSLVVFLAIKSTKKKGISVADTQTKGSFSIYDSFGKAVAKEDIYNEVSSGTILIYDQFGKPIEKDIILRDAPTGQIDMYDQFGKAMPKEVLMTETNQGTIDIYDQFGKALPKEEIYKEVENGNIEIYDQFGNAISKDVILSEAPKGTIDMYDQFGKAIPKEVLMTEETTEVEVTETMETVETTEETVVEEKTTEVEVTETMETIETTEETIVEEEAKEISLVQKQPGVITIQDQFGNAVEKEDIINEVNNGNIVIQDEFGNAVEKENVEETISNGKFNIIDKFGQAIAKEVVINEDDIVEMSMIDDFPEVEEKEQEEQRPIMSVDEVSEEDEEEVETEEEDEEETDTDEPSSSEELVTARISQQTGKMILIRYKKSFSARLNLTDDVNKDYHTALKNKLLSYKKVKARISWNYEAYNFGRVQAAKINVRGKSVFLYLPLDPEEYADTKYRFKDCSHIKKYHQLPLRVKVKSKRGLKWAFELIEQTMQKLETVENTKYVPVSFYEKNRGFDRLLDEGLIKEVIDSKTYENLTEINKEFLDSNKIRSIDLETIKNIEINEDVYQEVISNIKKPSRDGKKDIINVDTICKNFKEKEVVSIESLKEKKLIKNNVSSVKCLARGTLDKRLVFELDTYSKDAIKMILITGGKIQ